MTWKPTDHLHYALGLVEQIETDAQACGIALLPTLKWRMAQVISEALATAENNGRVASEIDVLAAKYRDQNLDGVPHVTITNGKASVSTTTIQSAVAAGYAHTMTYASEPVDHARQHAEEIYPDVETGSVYEPEDPNYTPPDPMTQMSPADAVEAMVEKAVKRGRGRPKGAKGKKKRAKAKARDIEIKPAMGTPGGHES